MKKKVMTRKILKEQRKLEIGRKQKQKGMKKKWLLKDEIAEEGERKIKQ